jgi:parallel beta-helix repeat protein
MKTSQFWLALAVFVVFLVGSGPALGQPKPITACGTIISAPGSYVVTANLTARSTAVPCINVTSPAVTIDLGGFTLTGKGGSPGISSGSSSSTSGTLTVVNGLIKLFKIGINAPVIGNTINNVQIISNQGAGAVLGDDAQVRHSDFVNNGTSGSGDGLVVGSNALITDSTFVSNKGNGFQAKGAGAAVTTSRSTGNTLDGFLTHGNSALRSNTATGNAQFGFLDQGGGCTFKSNVASANGITGMEAFDSTFIGNNASNNKNFGFSDDGESTLEANTAFNNGFDGFVTSNLSTLINNTASANGRFGFNLVCPDNLINDTAIGNKSGTNFNFVTPGCQTINVLGL